MRLERTELNKDAEVRLTYDTQTKKLMLLFPADYILEDGWRYKITATIKPTQEAYAKYATEGYLHVGDPNTGKTSSGQKGFYSNNSANLHYVLNNQQKSTMEYPKPVIQVSNNTGSRLPDTGGIGTTWMYKIGALLLVAEILSFAKRTKEKQTEKE